MGKRILWIFTVGLMALLTLPLLIQDGMFMDGVLYTAVAKNLAEGLGTFWAPHFSYTWGFDGPEPFREHPPLVFGIQSLFFKVLGPSIYTERIYILCCLILQSLSILLIWRKVLPATFESKGKGWLALLFWFSIPVIFWGFTHNIQENTMGIFILLASFFALQGMQRKKDSLGYFIASGLLIVAASMSKGVPGFFPLAVPFLYALVFGGKNWSKMIWASAVMLLTQVAFYFAVIQYPPAYEALSHYVEKRLLLRISENPTVDSHFSILWRAFTELIPAILGAIILLIMGGKKWPSALHQRWAILFALIGLAGVVPLALTKVQRGFYMNPALPFFALSLAVLCLPAIFKIGKNIADKKNLRRGFAILSWSLVLGTFILTLGKIGKVKRQKEILNDAYLIGAMIPDGTTIATDYSLTDADGLATYLSRHFHISMDTAIDSEFIIYPIGQLLGANKDKLVKVEGDFQYVELYKWKED